MPTIQIEDFRVGIDRRRPRYAAQPGSLWEAVNVHLTRGGDIERAKRWAPYYSGIGGTFEHGEKIVASKGRLIAYSESGSGPVNPNITQISLGTPTQTLARTIFLPQVYVVNRQQNGHIEHYYGASVVTDWRTLADAAASIVGLVDRFALEINLLPNIQAARVSTTQLRLSRRRPGSASFSVSLSPIAPATMSAASSASVFADGTSDHGITVTFGGVFGVANQYDLSISEGSPSVVLYRRNMTPRAAQTPDNCFVHRGRVWAVVGPQLHYSALNDPTTWVADPMQPATSAGVIDLSGVSNVEEEGVGIAEYQGDLAVFTRTTVFIYAVGADATQFSIRQVIATSGALFPGAILSTKNDVFYLDSNGVRSLRARDSSGFASIDDVGTVFDGRARLVVEDYLASGAAFFRPPQAVFEPREGRFMLALGDKILVYSNFPQSRVQGWTVYEPGFTVDSFAVAGNRLYASDTRTIYLYGGPDGDEYPLADETPAFVALPFMGAQDDTARKALRTFDAAMTNEWEVDLLVDPDDDSVKTRISVVEGVTYDKPGIDLRESGAQFALEFTCAAAGYASISSTALDFLKGPRK